MSGEAMHIRGSEVEALRLLLGCRLSWIFGRPFVVEGRIIMSTQLALSHPTRVGGGMEHSFVSIRSERRETPKDCRDCAQFHVAVAGTLEDALGTRGMMYSDTSVMIVPEDVKVTGILVREAKVKDGDEEVGYDAEIRLELQDGRVLAIAHAPGVYEGVGFSFGSVDGLGVPDSVADRLRLGLR